MTKPSRIEWVVSETENQNGGCDDPYIVYSVHRVLLTRQWNPIYNQQMLCQCGHTYDRHFDMYERMHPVGCKYCDCCWFCANK